MSDGGYEDKASPAKVGNAKRGAGQPRPKDPIRARIVMLDIQGGQTHMIIASGWEQGIQEGMKGKIEGDGLADSHIDMVYNVGGKRCEAQTREPLGHIQQADKDGKPVPRYVAIDPTSVPEP